MFLYLLYDFSSLIFMLECLGFLRAIAHVCVRAFVATLQRLPGREVSFSNR